MILTFYRSGEDIDLARKCVPVHWRDFTNLFIANKSMKRQ